MGERCVCQGNDAVLTNARTDLVYLEPCGHRFHCGCVDGCVECPKCHVHVKATVGPATQRKLDEMQLDPEKAVPFTTKAPGKRVTFEGFPPPPPEPRRRIRGVQPPPLPSASAQGKYSKHKDEPCAICMEDMDPDQTEPELLLHGRQESNKWIVTVLPCGHHYHAECITDWWQRTKECPACRGRTTSVVGPGTLDELDDPDFVAANTQPLESARAAMAVHHSQPHNDSSEADDDSHFGSVDFRSSEEEGDPPMHEVIDVDREEDEDFREGLDLVAAIETDMSERAQPLRNSINFEVDPQLLLQWLREYDAYLTLVDTIYADSVYAEHGLGDPNSPQGRDTMNWSRRVLDNFHEHPQALWLLMDIVHRMRRMVQTEEVVALGNEAARLYNDEIARRLQARPPPPQSRKRQREEDDEDN
jgi:hypothetical protein